MRVLVISMGPWGRGGSSLIFLRSPILASVTLGVPLFLIVMPALTRYHIRKEHVRAALHPYKRLCMETYMILEQQVTCETQQEMRDTLQQAKLMFCSVALMHVCEKRAGESGCSICQERDAYGSQRPRYSVPIPLFLMDAPTTATRYEQAFATELHPYRRLCKMVYMTFEKQRHRNSFERMKAIAAEAISRLFVEDSNVHLCAMDGGAMECSICMDHSAYGRHRPKDGI